ncbi:DNA polymerase I [Zongyangia hominis]|uniref:DNA polymerase I n=1 Tax=Zongyangia hominis TaxID=2763677 RepID=A0A926ED58_9FIRM|nr:DNA polymerase I [Zongyangia hominis]MBC8570229.1 DNA polymerase I [Zongyangia hominis]
MKLMAVDGNSVLNRAFYGIRLLSNKDGIYTNAIFGFINIILKLMDDIKPDAVAFAFDLKAPTFRHLMFDDYKANRKGMPEELAVQLPLVKELLVDLGYKIVEKEGYEADDILGTLAQRCKDDGDECVIATGDRDSLQLVGDGVTVVLAATKMGRAEYTVYGPEEVREKYGVTPTQFIDVKALMGDASDNIPGVAGIGEKTATDLISRFGSIEYIFEHFDEIELKPGVRKKLQDAQGIAQMSKVLATIDLDAPVECGARCYVRGVPDEGAAVRLLSKLEMYSTIQRLGLRADAATASAPAEAPGENEPPAAAIPVSELDKAALEKLLKETEPVSFCVRAEGEEITEGWAACAKGVFHTKDAAFIDRLLQAQGVKLVTDNGKALHHHAITRGYRIGNLIFDVSLAAYLLSPTSASYDLTMLSSQYGAKVPLLEGEGKDERGALDAAMTLALYPPLLAAIQKNEQDKLLFEIEMPLSQVLAQMEHTGFDIDTAGVAEFGKELDKNILSLQERIYGFAGEVFNINSPKQLGVILFEKLELPTRKKTKTGYSTNADVLESLRGKHPIIEEILEYRKLTKLKSTYVDGLLAAVFPDGRIHSSFNQTETRTGRISSTEPNMQNIPVRTELGSTLRKFFKAPAGWNLIDADYSQIELRVLASIADDENMIAAFQMGEDIHRQTAAQVFRLTPLEVTPLMRSRAKAVNFGIVYGIGAFSLSQDIGVSVAEADSYIKGYLDTYRGVAKYMEEIKKFAKDNGYVVTLMGRRRYLPELSSSNRNMRNFGERVAMNTPIQGTAADIIKIAMVRVSDALERAGLKTRLILQVHDELILAAPPEEVDRASAILKEEMENAVHLKVPMEVDVHAGENWLAAKG